MADNDLFPAFLQAVKDVTLTLEVEHKGQDLVIEYRPSVALSAQRRIGDYASGIPALTVIGFVTDLVTRLTIDGEEVAVGRSTILLETVGLLGAVSGVIGEHAQEWGTGEMERDGEYMQRARRIAVQPVFKLSARVQSKKSKGKRR